MDNITTYIAYRKNFLVWLTAALSVFSAAARIICFAIAGAGSALVTVVYIILPIAANLILAARLPLNCGKRFYVTIAPVFLFMVYFFIRSIRLGAGAFMTVTLAAACIVQYALYRLTFSGKLNNRIYVLAAYLMPVLMLADGQFRKLLSFYFAQIPWYVIMDVSLYLCILLCIICPRKLAPAEEGEPYRLRFGDRLDGRLVRNNTPINKLNPYFMPTRIGAMNLISDSIEISNAEKYIKEKRRQGYKHFGLMHVIAAAYVRCCAELPGVNRFLAGQKIYARYDIIISMAIKQDMDKESPETIIKPKFDFTDTSIDVYNKFDALVQDVKAENGNSFDNLIKYLDYIPGLVKKFAVWAIKTMDYFGLIPPAILDLSPFHGSLFITSMGSLGIPPIYHHLYDFGNIPQFCSFGAKRTERTINADGEVEIKKYIDMCWTTDERTVDGSYYAAVLKKMRSYILHPERLDEPPEEVVQDSL